MIGSKKLKGLSELREARRQGRKLMWSAAFFSIFVNLLMLTGPLFMLQTYDRVLGARSEATLVALFAFVAFLFLVMGLIDWARGRLLVRLGARFQESLDRRGFEATIKKAAMSRDADDETTMDQQLKDLEALQRFYSSSVFSALFDMPWAPRPFVAVPGKLALNVPSPAATVVSVASDAPVASRSVAVTSAATAVATVFTVTASSCSTIPVTLTGEPGAYRPCPSVPDTRSGFKRIAV